AIACLTGDLEVGLRLHEHAHARAEQGLVVDERDADAAHAGLAGCAGMCARKWNIPSAPASALRLPPASCARSRMPGIPWRIARGPAPAASPRKGVHDPQ